MGKYTNYMNQRSKATPQGRKIHEESVRQINAVKNFPKKVAKRVIKTVKSIRPRVTNKMKRLMKLK